MDKISLTKCLVLGQLLFISFALTSCNNAKERLGLAKKPPDEFQVVRRAPLSLPPNFTQLPEPTPGAPRPQEGTTKDQAAVAVFGPRQAPVATNGQTVGESALLNNFGAENIDPTIREKVDKETKEINEDERNFMQSLIFWRKDEPLGVAVDAGEEQRRLDENAALGKAANEGNVPTIKRKRKALLEGLF
ncbi:MAG: DUF3035 domain-containing protein [Alphaproteobacteria bacterium]|nr:DUF3035 domain-containing protein [Alphaproteobacteria bacterium]